MNLRELSEDICKINEEHGWHTPLPSVANLVANLHSEVSELWEAYRKNELHAPSAHKGLELTCAEEELADIVIRAIDTAHLLGVDISFAVEMKVAYNRTRPYRHGGKIA